MFQAIQYGADKAQWDDSCDECYFLSRIGVNAVDAYNKTKPVLVVQGRDFLADVIH